MKCFFTLFTKKGLLKNIGNYTISIIIIFFFILCIIFIKKGYYVLIKLIDEISNNKKVVKHKDKDTNESQKDNINFIKGKQISNKNDNKKRKRKIKKSKGNLEETNGEISNKILKLKNSNILDDINNLQNNNILKNYNNIKIKKYILFKNKIEFNDYEINNLLYDEALEFDKRTYTQYYFSLLKMKHLIIFTFYTKNDYNSKIIKYILFLLSFALHFTINALFFNDKTMHKIYEDQGIYNFIYQIPQIIYSTFITSFISLVLNYLSLSEKNIIKLKGEKIDIIQKSSALKKSLLIKFYFAFILIFLLIILFWYYLSCFCAVYRNTQVHLIKDILISFGLSLISPFIINLIPGLLRIPSLKSKNRECIYQISKLIQLI